jgi:8-oxo-dGTP pyrophosphatase MutT (NUDIX family)
MFRRGKWDLPKGKLDEGESIEKCAVREVKEETGIKNIVLLQPVGITYHEYFDKHSMADVIKETHWFEMQANGEEKLVPQTDEDIEKIIWAGESEIRECLKNSYPNIIEIVHKFQRQ